MYRSTYNGYEVEWTENTSTYSRIMYDGVQFHDVIAKFSNVTLTLKVSAKVTPYSSVGKQQQHPVLLTFEITKELLEDFGVNILDYKTVKDESFIPNVIKVTSNMGFWHPKMVNAIHTQNTTSTPINTRYPKAYYNDQFFDTTKFDTTQDTDYKEQLKIKDELIEDLRMEIQDLKDEIEMLKALGQEC
jgi:hypothetical protein